MIAADRGSFHETKTISAKSHNYKFVKKIPSVAREHSAYKLSIHLICRHNSMTYQNTHVIYPAWDFFVLCHEACNGELNVKKEERKSTVQTETAKSKKYL